MQSDPDELHNLAALPEEAERVKAMKGRMGRHLAELGLLPDPVWGRNWVTDPETAARNVGG